MLLEIACFDIEGALAATSAGADRIELCADYEQGGITPSYGTLRVAAKMLSVPVFPIVRPRGGDFTYSVPEFDAMLQDVEMIRELGFPGVVLGALDRAGRIDLSRTARLVEAAGDCQVTFHRAFDSALAAQPLEEALEAVISLGCARILTSGGAPTAPEGVDVIAELVDRAGARIGIIAGGGVRSGYAAELMRGSRVTELHSAARVGGRLDPTEVARLRA